MNDFLDRLGVPMVAPEHHRPPRESYVRCSIHVGNFTIEPAVEWRWTDSFYDMTNQLDSLARTIAVSSRGERDPMSLAAEIGNAISGTWPGRAYFCECWDETQPGFAQVFQPYGIPRNR